MPPAPCRDCTRPAHEGGRLMIGADHRHRNIKRKLLRGTVRSCPRRIKSVRYGIWRSVRVFALIVMSCPLIIDCSKRKCFPRAKPACNLTGYRAGCYHPAVFCPTTLVGGVGPCAHRCLFTCKEIDLGEPFQERRGVHVPCYVNRTCSGRIRGTRQDRVSAEDRHYDWLFLRRPSRLAGALRENVTAAARTPLKAPKYRMEFISHRKLCGVKVCQSM